MLLLCKSSSCKHKACHVATHTVLGVCAASPGVLVVHSVCEIELCVSSNLCLQDYASILEHLIQRWELEGMEGLSSEAQQAQEYVCKLPPRIRRLADRTLMRKEKGKKREVPFTWIYDRTINM